MCGSRRSQLLPLVIIDFTTVEPHRGTPCWLDCDPGIRRIGLNGNAALSAEATLAHEAEIKSDVDHCIGSQTIVRKSSNSFWASRVTVANFEALSRYHRGTWFLQLATARNSTRFVKSAFANG